MKTPSDGWDQDEREVLESDELGRDLEAVRARHALAPDDQARLLARIRREAGANVKIDSAPAPRSAPWRWGLGLAAASILVIAGTAWMLNHNGGTLPDVKTPETTVAVASPSPVFYLLLEKPDIKVSPAALAWRGPGGKNPLLADLKPAFDAFRANDYQRADREFSALSGKYPASIEIAFYQGVSRLFLDNPQGAIVSLTAAGRLADSAFAWDVAWYRAIAAERAGDPGSARAQLTKLCGQADARAKSACEALKRLPGGRAPAP